MEQSVKTTREKKKDRTASTKIKERVKSSFEQQTIKKEIVKPILDVSSAVKALKHHKTGKIDWAAFIEYVTKIYLSYKTEANLSSKKKNTKKTPLKNSHEEKLAGKEDIIDIIAYYKEKIGNEIIVVDPVYDVKKNPSVYRKINLEEKSEKASEIEGGFIRKMVKEINRILVRNVYSDEANVELPQINVGIEFTFTNPSLQQAKLNTKKKGDIYTQKLEKDLEIYAELLEKWETEMHKYGFKGTLGSPGKNDEKTVKYKFELANGSTWGYTVTFDDNCIEIIGDPAPASAYLKGEVANLIDNYIFGVSENLRLNAGEDAGGGHINIDRKSAFGSEFNEQANFKKLLNFLVAFYNDRDYWKKIDKDSINAPFPDEFEVEVDMVKLIEKIRTTKNLDQLLSVLNSEVHSGHHKDLPLTEVEGTTFEHYQAINFEHFSEEDEKLQRLEVRRVPAQRNRQELLKQLEHIFKLVEGKNTNGTSESEEGRKGRNNRKEKK